MSKFSCHSCATVIALTGLVGRKEECPKCGADLHVCRNCQHWDSKSYNECREPQADRVVEKDRSNFCDFFVPGESAGSKPSSDLLAAAEALFKKS